MVLIELKKTFEKRRLNLIKILENQDSGLDLSKQHQIYGAIKEIENFLRTLDHLRELELNENINFSLRNDLHQGVFKRMSERFKR